VSKLSLLFKDRILSIHQLDQYQKFVIGHDQHCNIHIDSLAVRSEHATISFTNNTYSIKPEKSDADVYVNGKEITAQTALMDGDKINLGKHILLFSLEPEKKKFLSEENELSRQRSAWLQFLNGSDMGKTMPINKSMTNINHQDEFIALISNRKDGFYLSHLKGKNPTRVNDKNIGDRSICLKHKSRINVGPLELLFYLDEQL
jgi:pSer/pThr/pTyr-binding forkhead associated (FHA) protein